MFKKIIIGVLVIFVGIVTIAYFQPTVMSVTREIKISAAPDTIFTYINNAKKSYEWMPWSEGDPNMSIEYSGPDEGVGSMSHWNGKEMGIGHSEVIESVQNELVKTKLIYEKPFEFSQIAIITLTNTDDGTIVKWSVSGENNLFFKIIGLFINCDSMIGDEFNKGLNKLKSITETK